MFMESQFKSASVVISVTNCTHVLESIFIVKCFFLLRDTKLTNEEEFRSSSVRELHSAYHMNS